MLFGVVPFNAADPVSARLRVLDLKDGAARGHASGQWTLNALTLAPIADGSDASEAPPRVELIELASIELAARMPEVAEEGLPEPLTRIEAFGFDADGNLEVLSSDDTGLVGRTLDRTGAVLRTKHLGRFEFEVDYSCEIADGPVGTWLVAVQEGAGTTVHRIDVLRGTTSRVLDFARPVG